MKILAVPFKRLIGSSFLGLTICLLSLPTQALTVKEVPNPRQISGNWVTDSAEILSPGTEAQLNQMINQLESKNGAEIAVVTVPETKSAASPKEFATELFNYWHIGKKGQDNGVLFLISKGDRRVEIETGYGVEAILPDAKVGLIIEQKVTPRFKQSDFDGGTLEGAKALVLVLEGQDPGIDSTFPVDGLFIVFTVIWGLVYLYPVLRRSIVSHLQGVAGLITYRLFRQSIDLKPDGQSRTQFWHQWFEDSQVLHCTDCGQPLELLPSSFVTDHLTPVQKVAEEIGSVKFSGWRCPRCGSDKMHLRAYEAVSDKFRRCPNCQELTVLKQELKERKLLTSGRLLTTYQCQCCDYHDAVETEIAPTIVITGIGYTNSRGDSGDFGGGSSGGGGGGGSW
jgi:uncharacterized protein